MKKISISIPKPCYENWDAMTPEEPGKFCGSCQKTVIDFSEMSDRALVEFFKKPGGTMCGRFMPDQLDRAIGLPPKRIPWIRYFFTIAIPAFLVSCKFAGRQALPGEVEKTERLLAGDTIAVPVNEPMPTVGIIMMPPPVDSVYKPERAGRPVHISSIKKCRVQAITKDSAGFTTAPFEYHPLAIKAEENHLNTMPAERLQNVRVGGFSVSKFSKVQKNSVISKASTVVPLKEAAPSFSFYPNPIAGNAFFTIDCKAIDKGAYQMAILNTAGQVVQLREIDLRSKTEKINSQLNTLTAGVYFVRLTNKQTGKNFTEKIIVQ